MLDLVVCDRTLEKNCDLVESGVIGAASPKEAAAKSDVLPRLPRFWILLLRRDIVRLTTKQNLYCTSTASPCLSTRLVEMHRTQGCSYLVEGPVLGNPAAAQAVKLTEFVSGDPVALE